MNPMSAVGFLLAALSLFLFSDEKSDRRAHFYLWLARGCALLVTLVGAAKLVALFRGIDIGADQWLFSSKLTVGFQVRNVMAPNTAFNFLLLGSALLFLHSKSRRLSPWACICVLISGFESMLVLLGYAYGIKEFYGIASFIPMSLPTAVCFLIMGYGIMSGQAYHGFLVLISGFESMLVLLGYAYGIKEFYGIASFIPMSLPTAVCFLIMGYGIMSGQANHGFLAIITGNSAGGAMARRLLPAAILVPAVLGWLRLEGQRLGFYDVEFGAALYTVTNLLAFAAI